MSCPPGRERAGWSREDRRHAPLAVRQDLSATELCRLTQLEPDRRGAMRLLAISNALEGLPRAEAARLAGMERQALRDAVLRFTLGGLSDANTCADG